MRILQFQDSDRTISVGKILCLGRNYAAHAKEMRAETPEAPIVFLKPSSAIIYDGGTVIIPAISSDLHHEVEMVVVIGKGGSQIPVERAYEHVEGYAVGLDMTLRDVQAEAKKKGLPWSVSKGFDTSAPISTIVSRARVPDPHHLTICLKVNDKVRQISNTKEMIFRVDYLVSYLSTLFTLDPGDLIFTGTPEGVGRVVPGDLLEAELESVGRVRVSVGTHPTR